MLHKDMMGFGYLGTGGISSQSPSNLSPLAPPFTVDRMNTNPLGNFNETSSFGVPFNSSLHNWQYSHSSASGLDYYSNCDSEVDTLRTTSDYSYLGSEPTNPPSVHWAPLNPNTMDPTPGVHWAPPNPNTMEPTLRVQWDPPPNPSTMEPILRVQWDRPPNPNTMDPTSNPFSYAGATKHYYPPYGSQVVDDDASFVGPDEGSYDLLPTSGVVSMVGSSHVDYSQGLSSSEFRPPWGGFWNGVSEGKRGKRVDIDGSFHLEETDFPDSHVYRDYLNQGVVPAEYLRGKENPTATQKIYADVLGSGKIAGSICKDHLDDMTPNLKVSSIESSKEPIYGTSTIYTESHLESPSIEPVTFSSNLHKSYSPYEKGFQLFDSDINDCLSVTKTSAMPMVRPQMFGTKFPVSDTMAFKSMDIGNVTAVNKKDVKAYNQAPEKEPLLPPISEVKEGFMNANHLDFHTSGNDQHISALASCGKEEMLTGPLPKTLLTHAMKVSGSPIPDINVSPGFTMSVDTSDVYKQNANTAGSSDQNPSEDSPCWKRAPTSNAFPFESSEAIPPQNRVKKLEADESLGFGVVENLPHNQYVMGFSSEVCEPKLIKESLPTDNNKSLPPIKNLDAILPDKERSTSDNSRLNYVRVQPNKNDRDQYSSNFENSMKQYNLLNMSKLDSDCLQSQTKQLRPKEVNLTSKSQVQLQVGSLDGSVGTSDTLEDDCIPFHAAENVLCSSPSEEDGGRLPDTKPSQKVNVRTLASALHSISELLLLCSFDDEWELQDSEILEHAVININMCLSKKIMQLTPRQEPVFPHKGISHTPKEGATEARLHKVKQVGNTAVGQLDSYSTYEQKSIYGASDNKIRDNMDFVSLKSDADVKRHRDIVQNIKKVLDENFQTEEDISSNTLLYKNLWLNAEAELCVTGLKSRLDQVKIQMGGCSSVETKESSQVLKKFPSSDMSANPTVAVASALTPEAKDIPKQEGLVQDSHVASPRSDLNDVEASVMARFQILKRRGDNTNTSNADEKSLRDVQVQAADGTGVGVPWQIVGNKSFDVAVGSRVQRYTDHNNEKNAGSFSDDQEHDTLEDFSVYVPDDPPTILPQRNIRMHDQIASGSGWYEKNTSLDWEHVLKDDFVWQK